ncbi:hypothetical protein THRCLA_11215 [Thraustotheca clavata]|uniref:Uncharacterized protein n=1 Tax=Thraustotheca clavata TaxID=74557 RepID=A0A1V9Y8G7_9STRA|nr:hypothetical protein THRCLA_11215 [Thraustotheca clavata]
MSSLKEQGNVEFEAKRYKEAEALYAKAILQEPQQHTLYGNRSAARFHLEKYDDALKDAITAVALDPQWAKGYFRQGNALEALGRPRQAQKAYELAAKYGNNKRQVLQKITAVKKIADKVDREKTIRTREEWKEVYSNISDTKMRLGLLVLFWNKSTKHERFAFFMRFLEILAGQSKPNRISKYSADDMQEIPAVAYDGLSVPQPWMEYYDKLDLAKKADMMHDMYMVASPAEQTTIVNDMKYFVHELCGNHNEQDD